MVIRRLYTCPTAQDTAINWPRSTPHFWIQTQISCLSCCWLCLYIIYIYIHIFTEQIHHLLGFIPCLSFCWSLHSQCDPLAQEPLEHSLGYPRDAIEGPWDTLALFRRWCFTVPRRAVLGFNGILWWFTWFFFMVIWWVSWWDAMVI